MDIVLKEWSEFKVRRKHLDGGREVLELADSLSQRGLLRVEDGYRTGLTFRATSYVGSIRLGSFRVTIQPKIRGMPLLSLLRYAYGLRDLELFDLNVFHLASSPLVDLLLRQLASEAEELLVRGLFRAYELTPALLESARGRIDFQALALRSLPKQAALPCNHFPRMTDNPLNRAVLFGLDFGVKFTEDVSLRSRLRRIAAMYRDQVRALTMTARQVSFLEKGLSRISIPYRPVLRIVRLLLEGRGICLGPQSEGLGLPGFLFDMQRFYEAVLSKFLNENLEGCRIQDQYRLRGMMRYASGANPLNLRSPEPRPDFAILDGGRVRVFLDAKYRDLWEFRLPNDMLYQLAIYALSLEHSKMAVILFPSVENRPDQRIEILDPSTRNRKGAVVLRAVNLLSIAELTTGPDSWAKVEMRREYTRYMTTSRMVKKATPAKR